MTLRRTANGKLIDINALAAKHERTRAVGNMNVNARGDIVDSHNKIINDSSKRVSSMYKKTMQNGKSQFKPKTAVRTEQKETEQKGTEQKEEQVPSKLMDDFSKYDEDWNPNDKK